MAKNLVQNFTADELKKLVKDKTSCVTVHKSVYNLQLYPYHLTDISSSIKELLNGKVAKYDQKLNGILLGYKNLKLLTPQGSIICDSCYIHIDIEGEFYVFKPEIDSLLTGVVNKRSDNHVGCLVHRLFNVSVPNNNEEDWAGHNVSIGDELIMKIVYLDLDARLPYIKSQLVEIKTRIQKQKKINQEVEEVTDFTTPEKTPKKKAKNRNKIKSEENSIQEESNNELDTPLKKKQKRIKKEIKLDVEELETYNNGSQLSESFTKKKAKNRDKIKSEENSIQEESNNELDTPPKKKQKRIKKEIKVDVEELETDNNGSQLSESFTNKKAKNRDKIISEENSIQEESNNELDAPLKKKQKRIKKEIKVDVEELETDNNGSQLSESFTKKKVKSENVKTIKEIKDNKLETKKKRKSIENKTEKNSQPNKIHKANGYDAISEEIKTFDTEEMYNKMLNHKSSQEKTKKLSEEHKQKRESTSNIHADSTLMADSEDRKSKKRKSSLSKNIIWDNKELHLHDSELEKTLGESWKPPIDESLHFNLVKIAALNESNKLERNMDSELENIKVEKKRKRKRNDEQPKPKKTKQVIQNEIETKVIKNKSNKNMKEVTKNKI